MKVRIGVGIGAFASSPGLLHELLQQLESLEFDSLWAADVLSLPSDDALAVLAYAAGVVPRLKLGTTLVLPGRNPVRLAKELATIDRLSGGRLLVTLVSGLQRPAELESMGVRAEDRGALMDELLPLLRRLWNEDDVDHDGPAWPLRAVSVEPKPLQRPLEVWLGGLAPSALRRAGRLADGWLPSLCTPEEAAAGRKVIEEHAVLASRSIDPEHFGVSVGYSHEPMAIELRRQLTTRRPNVDVADLVPVGLTALRRMLEHFVSVGFSKFVVRPVVPPRSWRQELEILAGAVLDLQT
jgi:probable F420-dependent oxidoreductase